jgi:glycosyltransferase involved in cell wall biosynthesis
LPRVLFLQATDPAAYPPLLNAGALMAEAGWDVHFLSAPMADLPLSMPTRTRVTVHTIPTRPTHVMRRGDYLVYAAYSARLALSLRPRVVYASDILGAGPGLLAARLSGAALVYHEHDPPGFGRPILQRLRRAAARTAELVVFPNEARAQIAKTELGFSDDRLRVVWNLPRQAELPELMAKPEEPLWLYYHGSIAPDRIPETMLATLARFDGRVRLRLVGYEAPGSPGYLKRLLAAKGMVEYRGLESRHTLLRVAASGHVGLTFALQSPESQSMRHLAGASNKAFDYMAAGLALLVPDLPEWQRMFVAPGYARPCDPGSVESVASAIAWFLDRPEERRAMAERGRAKIEADWNYDAAFGPVLNQFPSGRGGA